MNSDPLNTSPSNETGGPPPALLVSGFKSVQLDATYDPFAEPAEFTVTVVTVPSYMNVDPKKVTLVPGG